MEYCNIGDIKIPQIGLGLYSIHGQRLIESIHSAIEFGYSLFDTAYRYDNEREIGYMNINTCIVSTKISGLQYNGNRRCLYLDRRSIRSSVKAAKRRLRMNPLDIVLLHSPFPGFQKAFEKLLQAQQNGDVRVVGVSGFDDNKTESLKNYCGVYPQISMLELHPFHTTPDIVEYFRSRDIKIMARSPFAHGEILTSLSNEQVLKSIVLRTNKSVPQIVLRWGVQHGWIVIPRSSNVEHIRENINIFDFELTDSEMNSIDSLNRNKSFGVVLGSKP